MRRMLFLIFLLLFVFSIKAQKFISLSASGNFNFLVNGLATNDAGIGANIVVNFFSLKKLQIRMEGSVDHFFGDKVAYVDTARNLINDPRIMFSIKAGPEIYCIKNLSIAALYGFGTYHGYVSLRESVATIKTGELKFQASGHWGKKDRVLTNLYFSSLLGDYHIHFLGISIGYRIF